MMEDIYLDSVLVLLLHGKDSLWDYHSWILKLLHNKLKAADELAVGVPC